MDELAGRAWDEEYNSVKPQLVAPHYRQSTVVQTILPDESVLGNLACTIPDAISACQGKAKLQEMSKMDTEGMALIDEEITASNEGKSGQTWSRGHIFRNSTPTIGTQRRGHINLMITYQKCVDAMVTEK